MRKRYKDKIISIKVTPEFHKAWLEFVRDSKLRKGPAWHSSVLRFAMARLMMGRPDMSCRWTKEDIDGWEELGIGEDDLW